MRKGAIGRYHFRPRIRPHRQPRLCFQIEGVENKVTPDSSALRTAAKGAAAAAAVGAAAVAARELASRVGGDEKGDDTGDEG